ncbi:unnamed protein product [Ixodes hexagonus]
MNSELCIFQGPHPYSFGYDTVDEFGNKQYRHETSDANNFKRGSYGYTDANGIYRQVDYIADANGFRATVRTNEPGTAPSAPAGVLYDAKPVPAPATVRALTPVPLVLAPVPTPSPATARFVAPVTFNEHSFVPPQPYHFNYDNTDEYGTRMTREETSDANNAKVGSYSYTDATGVSRTVKYVADENGFRATVETNEPGTKSHVTGDAEYFSSAPQYAAAANPAPARPVPPEPYSFGYDSTNENGTRITREESGDANNVKTGSYSYIDPAGVQRTVKYVADAEGFHVTVETNEPGTKSSNPADAQIVSSSVEEPAPVEVKAAPVAYPTAQRATPIAVHLAQTPLTYTFGKAKSA